MPSHSIDSDIFFPPRQHADFVVHYEQKALHVHKLILHQHSAYFKAYFDTLPSTSTASPSDNNTLVDPPCNHPQIAHCIHLPQQTTLVLETSVTAAHFELFLCHLYFSAHYCYPPYLPRTDIDLDSDPPPLSHNFPPVTSLDWSDDSPLRSAEGEGNYWAYNEPLLTLAHYLDCAAMMRQCEAVLLTKVARSETQSAPTMGLIKSSVLWLQYSDRYHLHRYKRECIAVIAEADKSMLETGQWKRAKSRWDKALVLQVLEARVRGESEE